MDRTSLPVRLTTGSSATPAGRRHDAVVWPVPSEVRAPDAAPNVLVVLIDDMGYGAPSAFGGPCRMPTADRLADGGLRYSRFHTAALCAPTRAALLTGRNHHSCAMGAIPELATQAPGYTSVRPASVAPLARTLSLNGYATGAFGKMHQTPAWEISDIGPFDRWPLGEGFQRFYGFLGGEIDHFNPTDLIDGITRVDPPRTPEEGYHFSEDIADRAIEWIDAVHALDPDKPWFTYLSYGATHAPLHVPEEWRQRYRGEFSHGWDEERNRILARQQELGLAPAEAKLPPWPEDVPHWDQLSNTQRLASERLMELYAAFAEHCDAQTGRLVDALAAAGELDNTLIIYILGDNGASTEGGLQGTVNEASRNNGFDDTAEEIVEHLDHLGGPMTFPHYPVGWALALNTPYAWAKQVASHYGGTRDGMIVHWPRGITSARELRHQWHHVIDVAPTILEAAGLPQPQTVDGVDQHPIEGTSFAYTFDTADAPERHTTQYFEIFGNRGIYHQGWTAVAKHRTPWRLGVYDLPPLAEDTWELYDTNTDWTQAHDLAAEEPERLRQLQELFTIEAARHQVFPIDDRLTARFNPGLAPRRDLMNGRNAITLTPRSPRLRENVAPNFKNCSFTVTAAVTIDTEFPSGVIVAQGGRFGGWSFYLDEGKLAFCHNRSGKRTYVTADQTVPSGAHHLIARFSYDGGGVGSGGTVTLSSDDRSIISGRIDQTTPFMFSQDETLDIGQDRGTPVVEKYAGTSSHFSDQLHHVLLELDADGVSAPADQHLRAALAGQ